MVRTCSLHESLILRAYCFTKVYCGQEMAISIRSECKVLLDELRPHVLLRRNFEIFLRVALIGRVSVDDLSLRLDRQSRRHVSKSETMK